MYIPQIMKKQIARAFYDKEVEILEKTTNTDAEGGVTASSLDLINKFKGNVNFSNCKQIQEEYGLDYLIDLSITTDYDGLKHNDFIKYKDVVYNVTDIFERDSHNLVVATKWQQ